MPFWDNDKHAWDSGFGEPPTVSWCERAVQISGIWWRREWRSMTLLTRWKRTWNTRGSSSYSISTVNLSTTSSTSWCPAVSSSSSRFWFEWMNSFAWHTNNNISQAGTPWHDYCVHLPVSWATIRHIQLRVSD